MKLVCVVVFGDACTHEKLCNKLKIRVPQLM